MQRNQLDPDEQTSQLARLLADGPAVSQWQNPLASSNFKQFEWAKENPQVAAPLAKLLEYLSYLPMGSRSGTMKGNAIAHEAKRPHVDQAIGGADAATGIRAYLNMHPESTSKPPLTYPPFKDQGRGPANANKSLQIDDPYMQAGIDQAWAKMVRDMKPVEPPRKPTVDINTMLEHMNMVEEAVRKNPNLLKGIEPEPPMSPADLLAQERINRAFYGPSYRPNLKSIPGDKKD